MRLSPPALLLSSFAGLILGGTFLLWLPLAGADGRSVGLVDALFTATSAVCVTGLAVVDTATRWSGFGQGVILLLIQLGGLGIVTFSTLFVLLAGGHISLAEREIVVGAVAPLRRIDVLAVLQRIVLSTLAFEVLGAVLLWLFWRERFGGLGAVWHAVFHSVSAFCNAGFSTFSDNLVGFRGDWGVNLVVIALIVAGGIGFVVLIDVENRLRHGARVTLHTRTVLATSAWLIGAGAGLFLAFEWTNVLTGAPWGERLIAAAFASVTPRTAGFNTIDYGAVSGATLLLTILLMFIGGSPGSCAGGVKTTSAAVLFAMARAALRGREGPDLFRRTVPEPATRQAQSLVLLASLMLLSTTWLLLMFEGGDDAYHRLDHDTVELAFEAASALGTVGLSTGITPQLLQPSKLLLVLAMFVGRVGPLTIVHLLARRRVSAYRYATENVIIG